MMLSSRMIARTAGVVPARAQAATPFMPKRALVVRQSTKLDEVVENVVGQGDQDNQTPSTPVTGNNPITGKALSPVTNLDKEGYRATQQISQGRNSSARILNQLEDQPQGRSFGELQAFDGLAPEIINSRLAMLGFTIAAAFELFQGKDVFEQIKAYPLLTVGTFIAFTVASWIPFLKGQSYNVKSGPFTPAAEVTNGRIAMIGIVGLILFEAYFKGPFFPHLL